jgi:hypothetical protein
MRDVLLRTKKAGKRRIGTDVGRKTETTDQWLAATGITRSFGDDAHNVTDIRREVHGIGGYGPTGNANEGQWRT